jgi:hypothetical protein
LASTINSDNGVVSGSSGVKTTADTSGVLALQSNGSTGVTLDTSLNVGVGTTSPATKLHVVGNVRSSNGGGTVYSSLASDGVYATGTDLYLLAPTGYSTIIYANNSEKFRVGTAGQLGVGGANYGTSGQVLTSGGSGAAPTWASPAGGGSWVYLSTVTASNSATVDVETTFDSTYDVYAIVVNSLVASAEADIRARIKISGAYSSASIYDWISDRAGTNSPNGTNSANTATSIIKITSDDNVYSGTPAASNFVMYVYNPASTSLYKFFSAHGQTTSLGDDKQVTRINHCSNATTTSAMTGIRFFLSTGNITSGSFRLYGIKKS